MFAKTVIEKLQTQDAQIKELQDKINLNGKVNADQQMAIDLLSQKIDMIGQAVAEIQLQIMMGGM